MFLKELSVEELQPGARVGPFVLGSSPDDTVESETLLPASEDIDYLPCSHGSRSVDGIISHDS